MQGAEERRLGPIVVLAVDSLAERAAIWANLKQRDDVRLLIDARAGAEVVEIRALDLERDSREARAAYEEAGRGEDLQSIDAGLEDGRRAGLILVLGRIAVNGPSLFVTDVTQLVDRLAEYVHDAAERLLTDRHGYRAACIRDVHAALQSFR